MWQINPVPAMHRWFSAQTIEHVLALGMIWTGMLLAARPGSVALYVQDITGGLLSPVVFGMIFVMCGSALYTLAVCQIQISDTALAALLVPYFIYGLSAWIVFLSDISRNENAPYASVTYTILCLVIIAYVRDRMK